MASQGVVALPSWFSSPSAAASGTKHGREDGGTGEDGRRGKSSRQGQGGGGNNKLAVASARLTMTLARDVADLKGALYLRHELPNGTIGLAAACKQAGVNYNKVSAELKDQQKNGHTVDFKARGPPHVSIAMAAIIYGASKQFEEGGNPQHVKLRDDTKAYYEKEISTAGVTAAKLGRSIPYFRSLILKPQNGETAKAIISMCFHRDQKLGHDLSLLLGALVESEGGIFLSGAAPRGPLEREIGTMVGSEKKE
ncbi:unnamed protein product [Prorocentrum cordatum]|uniref:Uncharacterized protein n=1 Tax=Prorocentrum cordatum TaxID=2364126 RepID=A0ABN9QZB8_9DINO|nr:unnamed protein product [Polarella glacialis]